ncbi:MAG: ABC transporter ATP-binding protein [Planctomycetes bacterium]|nr:ABC transporter ATP-binding protein [Planctomycetota bacterium]
MSEPLDFAPGAALTAPILEAVGLRKSFRTGGGGRLEVLKGVDFKVHPGEIVAITGESGSGKSTLLHLLGLLDTPTDGEVRFHGTNAAYLGDRDRARIRNQEIGFVFQLYFLVPELTALENVFTPSLIRHSVAAWWGKRRAAREHAMALLERVGLAARAGHRPHQLSGGESQRVALARALMHRPGVVLCDEPTGNLDPGTKGGIHELILDLNRREGQAFVIVTHDRHLSALAGRTLEIRKDGRLHPVCVDAGFPGEGNADRDPEEAGGGAAPA